MKDWKMSITVYHNPRWGKSRQTLQILNEAGKDCTVIEYLKEAPSKEELEAIFKKIGISPSEGIRKNESDFKDNNISLHLNDKEKLLNLMVEFPKIIERPIVVTKKGAVIARPPEKVFEIL